MSSDDSAGVEHGSLAGLIEALGEGVTRRDRDFARSLARALHLKAPHIGFPEVEALGLVGVVATFSMDDVLSLVITGSLAQSGGECTLRWRERDFPRVRVALTRQARAEPYLFATLDFSVRGHRATLRDDVPPFEAGESVRIRCLSTVGEALSYRVRGQGGEGSVAPDQLEFDATPEA